jgi:serine/threonine-protein kinase
MPSPPPTPPVLRLGRYEVLEEIARGGNGVVLRAYDPDLKRDLALKALREEYSGRPDLVRRFVEEAQVTAQLQHPGVPPVHEVGELPDRRPFFAMKLIPGRTLAELLRGRSDPGQDLPRFLQAFEQIAQTVAYAHSRGVLHRDLKPRNVMVGGFGEVQVMDWGLAKVLPQDEAVVGHQIRTTRTEDPSDRTLPGAVQGTLAYMAPEQAHGDQEAIDRRADVFGLGAILCEILTGTPPYTGTQSREVYQQALRADLTAALARLDGCGADPELTALARDCLQASPDDRPPDAGAVAERVGAYRAAVQ